MFTVKNRHIGQQTNAYICAGLAVVLWSTVATAFKLALEYWQPLQLVFAASVFSALALLLVLLIQRKLPLLWSYPSKKWFRCLVLGWLNPCLYYLVLFEAYDRLLAQEALVINYSWPVMLVLLAVFLLKQKIRALEWLAIALAYIGVIIVATRGDLTTLQFTDVAGVLLAFLSTLIWAGYWILNMKQDTDPTVSLFYSFLFSVPVLGICVYWLVPIDTISMAAIAGAAYVGFFEMGITFALWLAALNFSKTTANVSQLAFVAPFLSLLFIHFILGEHIALQTLFGLVLIVAGIVLQTLVGKSA